MKEDEINDKLMGVFKVEMEKILSNRAKTN